MSSEVLLKLVVSLEEFNELNDIRIYLTYIGVVDEVDLKVGGSMKEGYTCDGQDKAPCDLDIYLDFEAAYHLRLTKILLAGTTVIAYLSIDAEEDMLIYSETTLKYGAC